MPAAVETAVYSNTPAWHGLGVVLDSDGEKGLTVAEALEAAQLDWEVRKAPTLGLNIKLNEALAKAAKRDKVSEHEAFLQKVKSGATLKWSDLVWVDGRFNTQRQSDGSVLGNVGGTWQPVQNDEGFAILQDVIEQAGGTCWIESAGSLEDGRRVWVLAHIDTGLQIAGESYASYLLFTNGHNGRVSVTAAAVDMRVVCANTLDFAIREAQATERIVRVRHTTKASERIKEAHAILGMRNLRAEELARQGEWLVESALKDDGEFENFLQTLMPVPEDQEDKPAGTMIKQRQDKVREIYMQAPNLAPLRGTYWGAVQSVLEYADHGRRFDSAETQLKAQWGITNQSIKQNAFDLALALAGAE